MKVGMVTFDASLATLGGGITSAPRYVEKSLRRCDESIDYEIISVRTGRLKPYEDDIAAKFKQAHWREVDLSGYDYVFIAYPASASMRKQPEITERVVSTIKSKFGVLIHDEYELREDFKDVIQVYFDNPKLDFIQYISPGTEIAWRNYYNIPEGIKTFIVPCYPPDIDKVEFTETKTEQLVNAARIVSRKKILQLLKLIPLLNMPVKVYGILQPGIYVAQLQREATYKTHYLGMYPDGEFPTRDSLISWNAVLMNKGYTSSFSPRIELGTIEALKYGTLPLLLKESVPDWFPQDYVLLFSWFNQLGNMSWSIEDKAKVLNEKFDIVRAMSKDDRESLAMSLLKSIVDNTRYMEVYSEIANHIKSSFN